MRCWKIGYALKRGNVSLTRTLEELARHFLRENSHYLDIAVIIHFMNDPI